MATVYISCVKYNNVSKIVNWISCNQWEKPLTQLDAPCWFQKENKQIKTMRKWYRRQQELAEQGISSEE